jgi:hypothetical protein
VGIEVGAGVKAQADLLVEPMGDTIPGLQLSQTVDAAAPVLSE